MSHQDILDAIKDAWGWAGPRPQAVVMENAFGNVIVTDDTGRYWRICPERLSCRTVATTDREFAELREREDFQFDWTMRPLLDLAIEKLGPTTDDRCYCLKFPAGLGGEYTSSNIGVFSRTGLIRFAGDVAFQIKDLPEGAKVRFKVVK